MARVLTTQHGQIDGDASREEIAALVDQNEFFWLDIVDPTAEDITLLKEQFKFHPLAIEDAEHFGQRPKLEEYDDFIFFVVYGAAGVPGKDVTEVHCFHSNTALVTVRADECSGLNELRDRFHRHHGEHGSGFLLYKVFDALVDSFFPILSQLGEEAEGLEDEIFDNPKRQHLRTLADMKRQLVTLRKVIAPERDMLARLVASIDDLDSINNDTEHYFRDVYDHLIRLNDEIESYRDLVSSGRDTYLSAISNVQNEVMKKLAIVTTIFLPVSCLTGYFGQNFALLVNNYLNPAWTFYVGGIVLPLLCLLGSATLFKRRGWM